MMDVEDLLRWACAELARKRPESARRPPSIEVGRTERCCLGRWDFPMGYPPMSPMFSAGLSRAGAARGDPPHADALIVEAAIGGLRLAPDDDDLAATMLGLGFELEADKALRVAFGNCRNLLVVHGRLGKRPAAPGACEPFAELAGNGKPAVWRRETWDEPTWCDHARAEREVELPVKPLRRNLYPAGSYCRLIWAPDPRAIVMDRAEYRAWIRGLEALARSLDGAMASRIALAPEAEAAPWALETAAGPHPEPSTPEPVEGSGVEGRKPEAGRRA